MDIPIRAPGLSRRLSAEVPGDDRDTDRRSGSTALPIWLGRGQFRRVTALQHASQLNLLLGQKTGSAPVWVLWAGEHS
jgi:hypothetical protein